jgi:hypothetical protein
MYAADLFTNVPVIPAATTVCILKLFDEFFGIVKEITPVELFVTPPIKRSAPVEPAVGEAESIGIVKSVPVPNLEKVRPVGKVSRISSIVTSEVVELLVMVIVKVIESPGEYLDRDADFAIEIVFADAGTRIRFK